MGTLSFRVSDDEKKLINNYIKINNLNLSGFIRESILSKIEDDLKIDEDRILQAKKSINTSKKYSFDEIFGDLDD